MSLDAGAYPRKPSSPYRRGPARVRRKQRSNPNATTNEGKERSEAPKRQATSEAGRTAAQRRAGRLEANIWKHPPAPNPRRRAMGRTDLTQPCPVAHNSREAPQRGPHGIAPAMHLPPLLAATRQRIADVSQRGKSAHLPSHYCSGSWGVGGRAPGRTSPRNSHTPAWEARAFVAGESSCA